MKIQLNTNCYNERRYGRPWIAKVTFTSPSKADFEFGEWCGDHGSFGLLVLDNVEPNSVIALGQKDFRKPANSAAQYWIVPPVINEHSESWSTADLEEAGFRCVEKKDAYLHVSVGCPAPSAPTLPVIDPDVAQQLRDNLAYIDRESDLGRAQDRDVVARRVELMKTLRELGIEYNTPNLILLGSRRYKKYAANYGIELQQC